MSYLNLKFQVIRKYPAYITPISNIQNYASHSDSTFINGCYKFQSKRQWII
jgi:hypothetical protein